MKASAHQNKRQMPSQNTIGNTIRTGVGLAALCAAFALADRVEKLRLPAAKKSALIQCDGHVIIHAEGRDLKVNPHLCEIIYEPR